MINFCASISKYQINVDSLQQYVKKFWNTEIEKVDLVRKTDREETYRMGFKDFEMYVVDHTEEVEHWDSTILNSEFKTKQEIIMAIAYADAIKENIYSIVKHFMDISKTTNTDMLITSEVHNDICFVGAYSKTGIKWDDSFYKEYKDFISE